MRHLDEEKPALEQVAFADRLVMNKTDLVTDLKSVEARVKSSTRVDLDFVLATSAGRD